MTDQITTVCLDFDGVLAYYNEWDGTIGQVNPEGKKLAEMIHDEGYRIVIQSCRTNPQFKATEKNRREMKQWLEDNDIPFDNICVEGKAFANIYVDDRGINFPKNVGPAEEVFKEIQKMIVYLNNQRRIWNEKS